MTLSESKAEVCTAARVLAAAHLTGIDVGKAELVFWKAVDRYALALYASTPDTWKPRPTPRLVRTVPDPDYAVPPLTVDSLHRELLVELAKVGPRTDVDAWDVDLPGEGA